MNANNYFDLFKLIMSRPMETLDDHYYQNGPDMVADYNKYDNHPRNGTTIMVGEYATNINGCCGTSPANVQAAIADAVFASGLERNSDLVQFAAYAPTFTRDGQAQWNPGKNIIKRFHIVRYGTIINCHALCRSHWVQH